MQFVRTVMLVDDDLDDHEVFQTACSIIDQAIIVTAFESGESALREMAQSRELPDLIFLDLNMPRFNGLEVLESIKKNERLRSLPVIVYTTSFDIKVKDRCLALGAVDVMEKPNSFDALCEKLGTILKVSV